jgi:hypothetical protein
MRVAREVDDAPIGVAHIILAPCLAAGCRSARRVLHGARVARDALQVVAERTRRCDMRRLVRSNRIDIKSGMERWLDPELCSF